MNLQPAIPALPTPGNIEVRAYDPKAAKSAQQQKKFTESEEFLVSPITGNDFLKICPVQAHLSFYQVRNNCKSQELHDECCYLVQESAARLQHLPDKRNIQLPIYKQHTYTSIAEHYCINMGPCVIGSHRGVEQSPKQSMAQLKNLLLDCNSQAIFSIITVTFSVSIFITAHKAKS